MEIYKSYFMIGRGRDVVAVRGLREPGLGYKLLLVVQEAVPLTLWVTGGFGETLDQCGLLPRKGVIKSSCQEVGTSILRR